MSEPQKLNPVTMHTERRASGGVINEDGVRVLKPVVHDKHEDFMDMRPVFKEPTSDPKDLSVPESASDLPKDSQKPEQGATAPLSEANIISPPVL